jgi:hypothetical protein
LAPDKDISTLPVALLVPLFEAPGAEPLTLVARDLSVGSAATCDLSIPFAGLDVRPEHARLRWCGDGFELTTMVADAPTFVNDQPLPSRAAVALRPGCTLALGRARPPQPWPWRLQTPPRLAAGESLHRRRAVREVRDRDR